jgi:hypothetical protein
LRLTKNYPRVSLLVLGGVSIATAFLKLDQLVSALISSRFLVQFLGQLFVIPLSRRKLQDHSALRGARWCACFAPVMSAFWKTAPFDNSSQCLNHGFRGQD